MSGLKYFARRFTGRVEFAIDFYVDTCPKAKMCMPLDQHREYVGCDLDSEVLRAEEHDLFLTLALQALNSNSEIRGDEEARAPAPMFKKNTVWYSARGRATAWKVTPGPDATEVMLGHNLPIFCRLYENYGLSERCGHVLLSLWSSL